MHLRLLAILVVAFACLSPAVQAQKKPATKADGGDWLKVPDAWLVNRFVQSNVGPRNSYRVGLLLPPGAKTPKVTKSSGRTEVDAVAFEYAKHLVSQNAKLREMGATKELVFNLELIPPVIDATEKSEAGREPIAAGKRFHTPIPPVLWYGANRGGAAFMTSTGFKVIFPASGGYAKEAIVITSSGDSGRDLFYIRNAVVNWKTSATSDRPMSFTVDMASRSLGPRNY